MSDELQLYALVGMTIGLCAGFALRWSVSVRADKYSYVVQRWKTTTDLLRQMVDHIEDYKDVNKTLHDGRMELVSERNAWRECAEALVRELQADFDPIGYEYSDELKATLAEFDRLKDGSK